MAVAPRHAPLAAAEKFVERRHRRVRISQARNDRVQVAKLLACPARRSLDALEPRACGFSAERFHLAISTAIPAQAVRAKMPNTYAERIIGRTRSAMWMGNLRMRFPVA